MAKISGQPGEEGEVLSRGPELFVGYADDEQTGAAIQRGWFRTGDLATVDADGWLTIVGRMKDVIIRAGENIAAAEVEGILEAHPEVGVVSPLLVDPYDARSIAMSRRAVERQPVAARYPEIVQLSLPQRAAPQPEVRRAARRHRGGGPSHRGGGLGPRPRRRRPQGGGGTAGREPSAGHPGESISGGARIPGR